jgi:hypothetical protein
MIQTKKNWAELAETMSACFTTGKRTSGEEYLFLNNEAEQWMKDLCYAVHKVDDVLPNDYIYSFILSALDLIAEARGAERLSEIEEDIFEIEGDIYNSDLLSWVGSNLSFSSYVDQALSEYGAKEHFNALSIGQALHKQAIAQAVLSFIDDIAEEVEE